MAGPSSLTSEACAKADAEAKAKAAAQDARDADTQKRADDRAARQAAHEATLERARLAEEEAATDTNPKLPADGGVPVADPTDFRSLAGALQYLTFTRPDISYVVQQICLHMHDPREPHLAALKRILRYVRGTPPGSSTAPVCSG